ncbi:MAG: hypothetical protein ACXVBL_05140, partial [Bdellovibrionota bacterium]
RAANGEMSLFIRPVTNFDKSYLILDAKLEGNPASLDHPTNDLWIFKVPNSGPHSITIAISLADAKQTDRLSESLLATVEKIENLQAEIAQTSDPQRLAALQAELNQTINLKTRLESELKALKNQIGQEAYSFQSFNNSISSVN